MVEEKKGAGGKQQKGTDVQAGLAARSTNLVVVGHVDGGKSTLLGHMFSILEAAPAEEMKTIAEYASSIGKLSFQYAFYWDRIRDERYRGITMESRGKTLRLSRTGVPDWEKGRPFCFVDTPGHYDFFRRASSQYCGADVVVYVLDGEAWNQSVERQNTSLQVHLFLACTYDLPVIILVNKIDRVPHARTIVQDVCILAGKRPNFRIVEPQDFSQAVVDNPKHKRSVPVCVLPVSAWTGLNVVHRSEVDEPSFMDVVLSLPVLAPRYSPKAQLQMIVTGYSARLDPREGHCKDIYGVLVSGCIRPGDVVGGFVGAGSAAGRHSMRLEPVRDQKVDQDPAHADQVPDASRPDLVRRRGPSRKYGSRYERLKYLRRLRIWPRHDLWEALENPPPAFKNFMQPIGATTQVASVRYLGGRRNLACAGPGSWVSVRTQSIRVLRGDKSVAHNGYRRVTNRRRAFHAGMVLGMVPAYEPQEAHVLRPVLPRVLHAFEGFDATIHAAFRRSMRDTFGSHPYRISPGCELLITMHHRIFLAKLVYIYCVKHKRSKKFDHKAVELKKGDTAEVRLVPLSPVYVEEYNGGWRGMGAFTWTLSTRLLSGVGKVNTEFTVEEYMDALGTGWTCVPPVLHAIVTGYLVGHQAGTRLALERSRSLVHAFNNGQV